MTASLCVVGAGRVGCFWLRAAQAAGWSIQALTQSPADAPEDLRGVVRGIEDADVIDVRGLDLVVVATSSSQPAAGLDALRGVAGSGGGPLVAHTSGLHDADVLIEAGVPAARAVAAHPVHPFRDRHTSPAAAEVVHAIQGLDGAVSGMADIVAALGGRFFVLPAGRRALYHLACVLVSNHTVTLAALADRLADDLGGASELRDALQGLLEASVRNLREAERPADALSGPVLRGDGAAIAAHVDTLRTTEPESVALYEALVRRTLPLVGIDEGAAVEAALSRRSSASDRESRG